MDLNKIESFAEIILQKFFCTMRSCFDDVQPIVALIAERALSGWWRSSHLSSSLYLQRGAKTKKQV